MVVSLLATLVAAAMEPITVFGKNDPDLINSIYQSFGGTFKLSGSGVKGFENASISALLFDADMASIFPNISAFNPIRSLDSSSSRRAAVVYQSDYCYTPGQYSYRLFTVAQQEFISGIACNAVAITAPYTASVITLVASNVLCGANFGYVCSVPITLMGTAVGTTIGPLIQSACTETFDAITEKCGEDGGYLAATTTAPATFEAIMYATSAAPPSCTGYDCYTYTCNGNCDPGGSRP